MDMNECDLWCDFIDMNLIYSSQIGCYDHEEVLFFIVNNNLFVAFAYE